MYQNSVYHTFAEFVLWQNRGFIVKGHIIKICRWHFDLWYHKFCINSVIWPTWFNDVTKSMLKPPSFSYCELLNNVLGKMANVFLLLKIMSLLKNVITCIITNNVTWNKVDQTLHIFAVEGSHRHTLDHTAQSWHYDHWIKWFFSSYSGECLTEWKTDAAKFERDQISFLV